MMDRSFKTNLTVKSEVNLASDTLTKFPLIEPFCCGLIRREMSLPRHNAGCSAANEWIH